MKIFDALTIAMKAIYQKGTIILDMNEGKMVARKDGIGQQDADAYNLIAKLHNFIAGLVL